MNATEWTTWYTAAICKFNDFATRGVGQGRCRTKSKNFVVAGLSLRRPVTRLDRQNPDNFPRDQLYN
jgi:hypothetical protein